MRTLILTTAILAASAAAWAQLNLRVVANVPFDYSVTGVDAQRGTANMSINDRGGVRLSTSAGDVYRMGRRDATPTTAARLVFRRYADKSVLQAIELGSAGSVQFGPDKEEKKWREMGLTARIEMVALTTRVGD